MTEDFLADEIDSIDPEFVRRRLGAVRPRGLLASEGLLEGMVTFAFLVLNRFELNRNSYRVGRMTHFFVSTGAFRFRVVTSAISDLVVRAIRFLANAGGRLFDSMVLSST